MAAAAAVIMVVVVVVAVFYNQIKHKKRPSKYHVSSSKKPVNSIKRTVFFSSKCMNEKGVSICLRAVENTNRQHTIPRHEQKNTRQELEKSGGEGDEHINSE